jgi:hypothetical protein
LASYHRRTRSPLRSSADFEKFIADETEKWGNVIPAGGQRPNESGAPPTLRVEQITCIGVGALEHPTSTASAPQAGTSVLRADSLEEE